VNNDPLLDLTVAKAYGGVLHNALAAIIHATEKFGAPNRLQLLTFLQDALDKANSESIRAGVEYLKARDL
jgi:hypothetical protein